MEPGHQNPPLPMSPDRENAMAGAIVGHLDLGLSALDESTLARLGKLRRNALAHLDCQATHHPRRYTWSTHLAWLATPRLVAGIATLAVAIALGLSPAVHDALTPAWTDSTLAARSMPGAPAADDADDLPDDIPLYAFLDDGFSLWLQENTAHDTPTSEDNES